MGMVISKTPVHAGRATVPNGQPESPSLCGDTEGQAKGVWPGVNGGIDESEITCEKCRAMMIRQANKLFWPYD